MHETPRFSCFFVGRQSRLIQCARLTMEAGHEVLGIISPDPAVGQWAVANGVPAIAARTALETTLATQPFDYLFSVDNSWVIPAHILDYPKASAVNFHDAPLPRYAGVHATSWALMNGERIHGVTWHVMTEAVDAGDVLQQQIFPIAEDETALTLNAKCFEASIRCFTALLGDIERNRVQRVPQDLSERTYYPRHRRPAGACSVDWSRPAAELDAMFRALDFGPYPNPLGVPKIFLGDDAVIVRRLHILASRSGRSPGRVVALTPDDITVATATNDVRVADFSALDGHPLRPGEFLGPRGLGPGDLLPHLDPTERDRLTAFDSLAGQHEGFWRRRLSTLEPPDICPSQRALPDPPDEYEMVVCDAVAANLARHCEDGRMGDVVLTATLLYLSYLSGKDTLDVGFRDASAAGPRDALSPFFASLVPLRLAVDPTITFPALMAMVREEVETIGARASYTRDLPLRESGLNPLSTQWAAGRVPVAIHRVRRLGDSPPLDGPDLSIVIPDRDGQYRWYARGNRFDADTITRMREQFSVLLTAIAEDGDRSVGELPMVSEREREVVARWNDTAAPYPNDRCIHELFEAQVERTPEAVAVTFGETQISYRELNARANQLARHLQGLGVVSETLVGLAVDRSMETMIGMLGILKAGGAYVPLDPDFPKDRLAFVLRDTEAPLLVTTEGLLPRLPSSATTVVCIDRDWPRIAEYPAGNVGSGVTPDNLIYVIHTSGSTGRPKGVLIEHRSVTNFIYWKQQAFPLHATDRVLQRTTFSFDASVWAFFGPLIAGARIVLAPPERDHDVRQLVELIRDQGVTVMKLVPSLLRMMLDTGGLECCQALHRVYSGGEALSGELQERFFANVGAELLNIYGPTEATIDVTYWQCERGTGGEVVPIGRPVANTYLLVLDRHLRPVPVGTPGELHIGGVQLARGYLNRPALTAERFIPDPFSGDRQARLYKTGDLACWRPDGNIEFLGRIDSQVKLHGFRIELQEIEAVLTDHSGVRNAIVILREDQPGAKRLVGYVIGAGARTPSTSELMRFLKERLPEYMVPSAFVTLNAFPHAPNGKVDRNGLPAPDRSRPALDEDYIAPHTDEEKGLAGVWSDVLGVDRIGVLDNFFDLGGNSILSLQMVARVRERLGLEIPVVKLFQYPRVRLLAEYVTGRSGNGIKTGKLQDRAQRQHAALARRKRSGRKTPHDE